MFYFVLLIMTWNYTKHCICHKNNQTTHVQPPNNYLALFFIMTNRWLIQKKSRFTFYVFFAIYTSSDFKVLST